MKCYECGAQKLSETVEAVDLDGVAIVEATVSRCADCGDNSVTYPRSEEMMRSVALELVGLDRLLRSNELAWLRKYVGASGRDWAKFIGRTPETLSRWENGHEDYPLTAERLLRIAVQAGPMDWEYDALALRKDAKSKPIELKTNSAGRWVRL